MLTADVGPPRSVRAEVREGFVKDTVADTF
jgi:hypothetical protein